MRMEIEVIYTLLKKDKEIKKLTGMCKTEADAICNFTRTLNKTNYKGEF